MNIKTYLKRSFLTTAASSAVFFLLLGSQVNSVQAQPTTDSGRTLQDLQGGAGATSDRELSDLQTEASKLEIERNSRDRNSTGNSGDSPTIDASATGGNDGFVALVSTETGYTTVLLTNNTGAEVVYEVIGQTQPRTLAAGESARLDGLPMPTTITAERQNFGLVDMVTNVSEDGILEVALEQSEFDEVQGVLRVREDGYVFIN